jgi:hypothetical protein
MSSIAAKRAAGIREEIRIIRQKKNPTFAAKTFGAALTITGALLSALFTAKLMKRMGLRSCFQNARIKKSKSKKATAAGVGTRIKTSPMMKTKKALSLTTFSLTMSREIGQKSFMDSP